MPVKAPKPLLGGNTKPNPETGDSGGRSVCGLGSGDGRHRAWLSRGGPREVQTHSFLDKMPLTPVCPAAAVFANLSVSGLGPGYLTSGPWFQSQSWAAVPGRGRVDRPNRHSEGGAGAHKCHDVALWSASEELGSPRQES